MFYLLVTRDWDLVDLRRYLIGCGISYTVSLSRRSQGVVWLVLVHASDSWLDFILLQWPHIRVDHGS